MDFSLEHLYEIWDNRRGSRIEVGEDRDALNLVEIRVKDEHGTILSWVTMEKDQARLVSIALNKFLEENI